MSRWTTPCRLRSRLAFGRSPPIHRRASSIEVLRGPGAVGRRRGRCGDRARSSPREDAPRRAPTEGAGSDPARSSCTCGSRRSSALPQRPKPRPPVRETAPETPQPPAEAAVPAPPPPPPPRLTPGTCRRGAARPHRVGASGAIDGDWGGRRATRTQPSDISPIMSATCEEDGDPIIGKDDRHVPPAPAPEIAAPGRSGGCDGGLAAAITAGAAAALRRDSRHCGQPGPRRSRCSLPISAPDRVSGIRGPMLYFRALHMLGAEAHADEPRRKAAQPRVSLEQLHHKRRARLGLHGENIADDALLHQDLHRLHHPRRPFPPPLHLGEQLHRHRPFPAAARPEYWRRRRRPGWRD